MWSASSRTVTSTAPRSQCPWPMRSSSRPGQAIRMSTPPASACDLRVLADAAEDRRRPHAQGAGQRVDDGGDLVGELTGRHRAPARAAAAGGACCPTAASRATSGMLKARVLPEPVRPRPSTSRPARLSGSVAAWIGNGAVMPLAASASTSGAGTPRASKVVSVGSTVATAPAARRPARGRRPRARRTRCWFWAARRRAGATTAAAAERRGARRGPGGWWRGNSSERGHRFLRRSGCRVVHLGEGASARAPADEQGGLTSSQGDVRQPGAPRWRSLPDVDSCRSG